jgi:hypothetical protein
MNLTLKTAILSFVSASLAFGAAPSAGTANAGPAGSSPELARLISQIGADYKKARELSDTFFNPFKIEATMDMSLQKRSATVTEQSVAEAVGRKGVSGVLYGANAGMNQVIIGDQVFRIGDELAFPDGEGGAMTPLVAGASVVLREVGEKSLSFDFTTEGESARRSTFSLRNFWRP